MTLQEICSSLNVQTAEVGNITQNNKIIGFVIVRDSFGSLFTISSFAKCDEAIVFPAYILSEYEHDRLLSVSFSVIEKCNQTGVFTITYALQSDGADFAVIDFSDVVNDTAIGAFRVFDLDINSIEQSLKHSVEQLGYLSQKTYAQKWHNGQLAKV